MPQIKLDIDQQFLTFDAKTSLPNFLKTRNQDYRRSRKNSLNSELSLTPLKQRDFSQDIKMSQEKIHQRSNLKNLLKSTNERTMLLQRPKILEKDDSKCIIKSNEHMKNQTVKKKTRSLIEHDSNEDKYQSNTTYKWPYQSLKKNTSSQAFSTNEEDKSTNLELSLEKNYKTRETPAEVVNKPPLHSNSKGKKTAIPKPKLNTNLNVNTKEIITKTAKKGFGNTPVSKETLSSKAKKSPFLEKKPPRTEMNVKRTNNFRLQTPNKKISHKDEEVIRESRVPNTNIIFKKDLTNGS